MFWKKKNYYEADEKISIYENIKVNSLKIAKLEAYLENLEQKIKILRGLVNRKLKLEDEIPTEKNISNDGFDFVRGFK